MSTAPPASAAAKPTKCVRRGSTKARLHVRLDRLSAHRVEVIRQFIDSKLGIRPSAAVAIRVALGIAANVGCTDDPDEIKRRLERAVDGR